MKISRGIAIVIVVMFVIGPIAYFATQPTSLDIRYVDHEASFNNGVLSIDLFVQVNKPVSRAEICAVAILSYHTEGNLTRLTTSFTMFLQDLKAGINRIHIDLPIGSPNTDKLPVIISIKHEGKTFDFRFNIDLNQPQS